MTSSASNSQPQHPRAYLSRRYHLSASHRLHVDSFTAEQNRAAYGKCNNPHGHGHNYTIEVTLAGRIHPATGMVCDLAALDSFAQTNLLAVFDHMNLNTLAPFRERVPTTENLTVEIAHIFQSFPHAELTRVRVEETSNNSFEYALRQMPSPQRTTTKG
ncbi:MAG TPA: 6-carboxytetrahydropterin synthase [Acidobacteriaceae bacterium]|nr:6-carboxytetrahydropterin synthase [Acidobacteriaceae bacterium]